MGLSFRYPNLERIKIQSIIKLFIYILLLLPDDFFSLFTLYSNRTPDNIAYKWLAYSFGLIHLIIVALGFTLALINRDKLLWGVIGIAALREVLLLLLGYNSCFTSSSYEIYLTLFTGIGLFKIIENACHSIQELETFFWRSVFLNVVTVFLAPILGAGFSEGGYSRFNAVNMDVGSTGTICALLIVYCLFNQEVKYRIVIAGIATIALFLSGSRINLVLLVLVVCFGSGKALFCKHRFNKKAICILVTCLSIAIGILLVLLFSGKYESALIGNSLSRMLDSFSFNTMGTDDSVMGRMQSIIIGFDIIKDNPFGISGFFTNLQYETLLRGFPTFPHSSILDYYILLGPIVIALIAWLLIRLIKLYSVNFSQFLVLLYLIFFVSLSGGPIVNFKIVLLYLMIFKISDLKMKCGNKMNEMGSNRRLNR